MARAVTSSADYIVGVMRVLVIVSLLMANFAAGYPASPEQAPAQVQALLQQFDGGAALYARNLLSGEEIAFNANTRFPTASTIKTAVMLEAYAQAAEGTPCRTRRFFARRFETGAPTFSLSSNASTAWV